jgi:hypothetical protein
MLGCVEYGLIEKDYIQGVNSRGIDAGHEVLEVFAGHFDPEISEKRENRARCGRKMSAFLVRARSRRLEFNAK